jgi:hypothetical protein
MPPKTTKARARTSTDRWENEGGPSAFASSDGTETELKKLGITPVQLTVFHWGGYRYSNSRDAIAAAKRATKSGVS